MCTLNFEDYDGASSDSYRGGHRGTVTPACRLDPGTRRPVNGNDIMASTIHTTRRPGGTSWHRIISVRVRLGLEMGIQVTVAKLPVVWHGDHLHFKLICATGRQWQLVGFKFRHGLACKSGFICYVEECLAPCLDKKPENLQVATPAAPTAPGKPYRML